MEYGDDVAAILAAGPAAIETWQCVLEVLDGLVAKTIEHGWPEPIARQMVATQFLANIHRGG